MHFLKKSLLVILVPILTILFYATATNYGFVKVAGDAAKVKHTLANSGIYNSALDNLIKESDGVGNGADSVSLKDSAIKTAAHQTFNPQFIQTNAETVIDSLYRWLDGTTETPDFKIDLSTTRATFAKNAGAAVTAKLAALPACPAGTDPASFDSDNATCLPPGVAPAAEGAKVEQKINSGEGFLDHPVITASTLKTGDGGIFAPGEKQAPGKTIFNTTLKDAPNAFQAVKTAPYVMGLLAILLSVAVVFLSATKRKGLRKVGIMLIIAGVFLMGAAYGVGWGVNKQVPKHLKLDNPALQVSVIKLSKDVGGQIENNYWIFGGVYTAIGLGLIFGPRFIGKQKADKDDLEGEGKTKEDRIDLKEPDKAISLPDEKPSGNSKPSAKKPTPRSKPAADKPRKIIIQ
jgi:hypothetical protein